MGVQGKDVRVLELRCDLDLPKEPLPAEHRSEFRTQYFHRHLASVFYILGAVDRGHAAGTDLIFDSVPVPQRLHEPIKLVGHANKIREWAGMPRAVRQAAFAAFL